MNPIEKYFPELSQTQRNQFNLLDSIYKNWNIKINVISRKDLDNLYINHVLHSLSIAKIIQFKKQTSIIDIGTGGGFPGIPLAIMYPDVNFTLIDSIGKKIKVVEAVTDELGLKNIKAIHTRSENVKTKHDFIISRAVTAFPEFVKITRHCISGMSKNNLPNGILYLKGGDFEEEIVNFKKEIKIYNISDFFEEDFFETKKIIHLPINKALPI